MTSAAERYLQAHPDLALRGAADQLGDPLAHYARTGAAEGRLIPDDVPASLHWSDRVMAERMPEFGALYRLGVIASCRWAAAAHLGERAAEAGDVGSLDRVRAILPDTAIRRAFVEATFDDARLRLWADDLSPRVRWVDAVPIDVAAIRAGLGGPADVLILPGDGAAIPTALVVAAACAASGAAVVVAHDGVCEPEPPPGVRVVARPPDPVGRAVMLDHLRPSAVHAIGAADDRPIPAAADRAVFTHVRDRADAARVPERDASTTAFVVDDPRVALLLRQMHAIEPERVVCLDLPAPPPTVAARASVTGTLLVVPRELGVRIGDPGPSASYGVLHLADPYADHRLAAAIEAGVPVAALDHAVVRDAFGPDGALYVAATPADVAEALAQLRDDALLRNALAGAARAWAHTRRTPARLTEQLAALHAMASAP